MGYPDGRDDSIVRYIYQGDKVILVYLDGLSWRESLADGLADSLDKDRSTALDVLEKESHACEKFLE